MLLANLRKHSTCIAILVQNRYENDTALYRNGANSRYEYRSPNTTQTKEIDGQMLTSPAFFLDFSKPSSI